jgi:hypothetical protein
MKNEEFTGRFVGFSKTGLLENTFFGIKLAADKDIENAKYSEVRSSSARSATTLHAACRPLLK